jgi:hypothetical protein
LPRRRGSSRISTRRVERIHIDVGDDALDSGACAIHGQSVRRSCVRIPDFLLFLKGRGGIPFLSSDAYDSFAHAWPNDPVAFPVTLLGEPHPEGTPIGGCFPAVLLQRLSSGIVRRLLDLLLECVPPRVAGSRYHADACRVKGRWGMAATARALVVVVRSSLIDDLSRSGWAFLSMAPRLSWSDSGLEDGTGTLLQSPRQRPQGRRENNGVNQSAQARASHPLSSVKRSRRNSLLQASPSSVCSFAFPAE